ncbi:MAG: CinA family nicotinamide mononucleotide deamidase-related protein [Kofleriaceae bacterium]
MYAEILTIGDELCRGEITDTNSSYLAARLWDLDIVVRWMTSCRDDEGDLGDALALAARRADVVLCSGGLGPTEDDLTVDVVCRALGVEPVLDAPARARWEARFGGQASELQLRQLRVPSGGRVWANSAGAAPGFEVDLGGVPVVCLPGVPREVYAIFDGGLGEHLAELRDRRGDALRMARRIYRAFGRGESQLSEACRGLVDGVPGASIHYQVKFPETLIKLVVRDRDAVAAGARLAALDAELRARLGAVIYGDGEEALPTRVSRRLREAGLTVATAESCTGGMVGELLTAAPGSSASFRGGAVVYSNDEKQRQLGVRAETLAAHGAVSEACVREMAEGARDRFDVDLAVAVSGVAGPDGGTEDKPVGTVWLALARRAGEIEVKRLAWPGPRDMIRTLSAWWALRLLDRAIEAGEPRAAAAGGAS